MINDKLEGKYGFKFVGPGPSDYNPNKEKVLKQQNGCKIGTEDRTKIEKNVIK